MYIIFVFSCFQGIFADIIVSTTSGPVKGFTSSVDGVEAVLGIPYAEPPVGELRFAKPLPKKKWNETYHASKLPPPCAQVSTGQYYFMPDISNMSEDCLYLNIWIPMSNSSNGLKPVIVFIHPGAFMFGSASMKVHDGSKLASRGNVIVASINYRVGAFGYLWGFTNNAPGNMAIYDQIMALRWIKDNAQYFGGDPENIVPMGVSAGAYSTVAFLLSPLTQNLFRKVIIQSGSVLSPVLEDNNTKISETAESLASMVGCVNKTLSLKNNPDMVIECLKRKPVKDILDAEKVLMTVQPAIFIPRVYDEILPKSPVILIREGKFNKDLSVLIGINSDEGTMMMTSSIPIFFDFYGKNKIEITSAKRARSLIRVGITFAKLSNSTSRIADDYTNFWKTKNATDYLKLAALVLGDIAIACPTVFTANFLSAAGIPLYFYKFNYRAASTPLAEWMGTTHLDEIQYIFGHPYHKNFTAEETELSHRLMDRWSAFARTGYFVIFYKFLILRCNLSTR